MKNLGTNQFYKSLLLLPVTPAA